GRADDNRFAFKFVFTSRSIVCSGNGYLLGCVEQKRRMNAGLYIGYYLPRLKFIFGNQRPVEPRYFLFLVVVQFEVIPGFSRVAPGVVVGVGKDTGPVCGLEAQGEPAEVK